MAREKPTDADLAKKAFANLLSFDDQHKEVIQSLRFRDQDHSIRCGALLGFAGLIIASALVQLSAGPDTLAHLSRESVWFAIVRVSLVLLIASASLSLLSISLGRTSYSDEPWTALLQFQNLIRMRGKIETAASVLCFAGTVGSLGALLATLFAG
jgi:hypothetical protein